MQMCKCLAAGPSCARITVRIPPRGEDQGWAALVLAKEVSIVPDRVYSLRSTDSSAHGLLLPDAGRALFVLDADGARLADLARQLRYFGCTVYAFDGWSGVQGRAGELPPVALILDAALLD